MLRNAALFCVSECRVGERVYRLLVVGDAYTRPEDLVRQLAGRFDVDYQLLQSALKNAPQRHILIDINLDDDTQLLPLKDWLSGKPDGAKVIFVTDKTSRLHAARAYALGATDVIHHPINVQALRAKLWDGATLATLALDSDAALIPQITVDALQNMFAAACAGGPVDSSAVQAASNAVVDQLEARGLSSWVETVRMHHSQTYQHCLLVTGVAVAFGEHLGVSRKDRQRLSLAGMLHDIGKARIPLSILEKPGRLDENELAIMRKHPELGLEALGPERGLPAEMLDMVVHHHELLDGSGYPHGLHAAEISDLVRIMTISDIFGALIERRSYKPPLSSEAAYRILLDMGPKLDRDLVSAFKSAAHMSHSAAA